MQDVVDSKLPPVTQLQQTNTTRLIPSKYSEEDESVLSRIADNTAHLSIIFDLDNATNDRLSCENDLLPGISATELVRGARHYHIINAAFCHANPNGARFTSPDRGAWYAGFSVETAMKEIVYHKSRALAEINFFEDSVTYDAYFADFFAEFHDIRNQNAYQNCLDANDYRPAQSLGERLLSSGSNGIIYPSVRHEQGECIACFRPILVNNVRKRETWRLTWSGDPSPIISPENVN